MVPEGLTQLTSNFPSQVSRILLIVAHPDDETLMAGGTIRLLSGRGAEIAAMSFTDGTSARRGATNEHISSRKDGAREAASEVGFSWASQLNYSDQELDLISIPELAREIEAVVDYFQPNMIITHSSSDLNQDHRRILEATLVGLRPGPNYAPTVMCGEVLSATHWNQGVRNAFDPNIFIDVTQVLASKIRALGFYGEEMRPSPHARSIEAVEALASFRGSTIGVERAEAFELLRMLID